MKRRNSYPYILAKKKNSIKLRIMPKKTYGFFSILYIALMILFAIAIVGSTFILLADSDFTLKENLIIICSITVCIPFFLLILYLFLWKRKGEEIFILHPDKLENIVIVKPFKTEKNIFSFNKLEIGYQSGEDFYSEEEAILLGVELDLDKVKGNYPIQFYMDDGIEVVDSVRKIPIEVIRRIKKEFLLIQDERTNEF